MKETHSFSEFTKSDFLFKFLRDQNSHLQDCDSMRQIVTPRNESLSAVIFFSTSFSIKLYNVCPFKKVKYLKQFSSNSERIILCDLDVVTSKLKFLVVKSTLFMEWRNELRIFKNVNFYS